jgi:Cys-tRNA(Pro)/Cys-tRNA(Cys) deacylase
MDKTNSMRLLESRKAAYTPHEFSSEVRSADEVARLIGRPEAMVYKTLVVLRGKGKPLLVMIASNRELDLRLLARGVKEKKLKMAAHAEAEQLTGLQVGGISALCLLNKGFDIYIDEPARDLDEIVVSAGQRGLNLQLGIDDLVRITRARWVRATAE